MKTIPKSHILFSLLTGFLFVACLQDPTASNNEPGAPRVQYEDLTRAAVTLVGTVDKNDSDASYGFVITEVVDGAETNKKREEVIVLSDGDNAFSWTVDLNVGATYSARAFVSNGISRKYSSAITITTPSTSKATVSNVTLKDGLLMASIKDNGGRKIEEVGFVGGDTPDRKVLLRKEKLPASLIDGDSFSLPLSSFELGKTIYFVAYAIDEKEDAGYSPALLEVTVSEQDVVVFEDAQFGSYIVRNFDLNHDGKISFGEIKVIEEIDVSTDNISSVKEIALMPELRVLSCAGSEASSGKLTALLLDKNPKITKLNCANNQLEALDISNNSVLDTLYCSGNQLASLIVSDNPNLSLLHCYDNKISSLDISNNQEITAFDCHGNQLTQIDIARNTNLLEFDCQSNAVTQLDLSNNRQISRLNCSGNQLKALDVSKNRELESVWCLENPMDTLFLHANQNIEELYVPERTVLFYYISGMFLTEESVTIPVGEKHTLTAIIDPEDALGKTVTWGSSNEDIATVSEEGVITGVAPGTCTITASSYGKTASCSVTVFGGLSLTEETIILPVGETHPLTAVFDPEEAANNAITWSSSNEAIAKVSKEGVVSGISSGLCTITASCLGKTASCSVTVFGGISLTEETIILSVGETHPLTVVFDPKEAATSEITWSSSDNAVATVSENGAVSGVSAGICTITALCYGSKATCEVTVSNPVTSVSFEESEREVYVGENFSLVATTRPDNTTEKILTWASSNPSVATVSQEGAVYPIGIGSAIISATAASGVSASFNCIVVSEAPVFPDENFRRYVYENFDTDGDGFLSRREAMAVTSLSLYGNGLGDSQKYRSLSGIGYFINLNYLVCFCNLLRELDLSNNLNLTFLDCHSNQLTALDVSNNPNLTNISCSSNQLTTLDVSNDHGLTSLDCAMNQLTALDVMNNPNLTYLYCYSNQLTTLDLSNNPNLTTLLCSSNQLTKINVLNNPNLTELNCYSNQLTSLDTSNNYNLTGIACDNNQLTFLDISNNPNLSYLHCGGNQLTTIDVSNNPNLTSLSCSYNPLTTIDVSRNPNLTDLSCSYNPLTTIDVSHNTNLSTLVCFSSQLTTLDVSNNPNLTELNCYSNQLTTLDVSNNQNLTSLSCDDNLLTSLDISNNPNLISLACRSNQLTTLDLSNNHSLEGLYCDNNQLFTLDLSNNHSLTTLFCHSNPLTILDASNLINLSVLDCGYNQLTYLDVSNNHNLSYLNCEGNLLTTLDVSNNPNLTVLYCGDNPKLLDIWIADGQEIPNFSFDSGTTLHYK